MLRKIVHIDEEKCNGCGACANACHEQAIAMIDGKARLIKDDYCDGLGDCLPACPVDAIQIIEREASEYDEAAVKARIQKKQEASSTEKEDNVWENSVSQLSQWPVQIKLAPVNAPYFQQADILIAADCTAYAYAGFHQNFIRNHVTLIGCTKLDDIDYSEKLAAIFAGNDIRSIHVVRMEVPCCGGMEYAVKKAIEASGKEIPCEVTVIGIDGSTKK